VTGPVQVLVVGLDEPSFSGEVLDELTRLREAGIVRLVDVLLVTRTADGLATLPLPPHADPGLGQVAAALLGAADDDEPADAAGPEDGAHWSLDDVVPEGGSAAVALIEHTWAEPLVAAIRRAGGQPIDETWLAADDVARLERIVGQVAG
jgi:uncharacterized membrane protein